MQSSLLSRRWGEASSAQQRLTPRELPSRATVASCVCQEDGGSLCVVRSEDSPMSPGKPHRQFKSTRVNLRRPLPKFSEPVLGGQPRWHVGSLPWGGDPSTPTWRQGRRLARGSPGPVPSHPYVVQWRGGSFLMPNAALGPPFTPRQIGGRSAGSQGGRKRTEKGEAQVKSSAETRRREKHSWKGWRSEPQVQPASCWRGCSGPGSQFSKQLATDKDTGQLEAS